VKKKTSDLIQVYFQKIEDQFSGSDAFIVDKFGENILKILFAIIKKEQQEIFGQYIRNNSLDFLAFESNLESKVIELYGALLSKQQYKEAIALGTEVLFEAVIYGMSHGKPLGESVDFILIARRISQEK
jgi:hypothetical protein